MIDLVARSGLTELWCNISGKSTKIGHFDHIFADLSPFFMIARVFPRVSHFTFLHSFSAQFHLKQMEFFRTTIKISSLGKLKHGFSETVSSLALTVFGTTSLPNIHYNQPDGVICSTTPVEPWHHSNPIRTVLSKSYRYRHCSDKPPYLGRQPCFNMIPRHVLYNRSRTSFPQASFLDTNT